MAIFNTENKPVITFQAVIVLLIAAILFLSIPAFANDYPHLGWLCLAIDGTTICAWILLARKGNVVVIVFLCIFALIGGISYATGVPSEWHRLTNSPAQEKQTWQGTPSTDYVLTSLSSLSSVCTP